MTLPPALALQQAVLATLRADVPLRALLGGVRIFDAVPPRTPHPYVTFGPLSVTDRSAGFAPGHDHRLTLVAHSRSPGFGEAHALVGAITAALEAAALAPPGHLVVLLRVESAEFRRDAAGEISRGSVVVRVLTEPL